MFLSGRGCMLAQSLCVFILCHSYLDLLIIFCSNSLLFLSHNHSIENEIQRPWWINYLKLMWIIISQIWKKEKTDKLPLSEVRCKEKSPGRASQAFDTCYFLELLVNKHCVFPSNNCFFVVFDSHLSDKFLVEFLSSLSWTIVVSNNTYKRRG